MKKSLVPASTASIPSTPESNETNEARGTVYTHESVSEVVKGPPRGPPVLAEIEQVTAGCSPGFFGQRAVH